MPRPKRTPRSDAPAQPAGRNALVVEDCRTPGCGETDPDAVAKALELPVPRIPRGWVYALVRDSTVRGKWFCSAPCAHRGIALAELRLGAAPPK